MQRGLNKLSELISVHTMIKLQRYRFGRHSGCDQIDYGISSIKKITRWEPESGWFIVVVYLGDGAAGSDER